MPKTIQAPTTTQPPKRVKGSAKTTCSICMEDRYKRRMARLECGHYFCKSCIKKWAKHQNTCPQCRERFTRLGSQPVEETNQQFEDRLDPETIHMIHRCTTDWMFDREFRNETIAGCIEKNIESLQTLFMVVNGLTNIVNISTERGDSSVTALSVFHLSRIRQMLREL